MPGSILSRIASGDQAAVQECLDTYGGLVWSLARRLTTSTSDAEDAVQEIFIDIWKNASRYDAAVASESVFVTMIARRRLIDRMRQATRRPEIDSLTDEVSERIVDTSQRHDRRIELCLEAARADEALHRLRPEQQEVLKLAIYQGLTHQEIAASTGLPLGTVKTHARRGLHSIREALGIRITGVRKEAV